MDGPLVLTYARTAC